MSTKSDPNLTLFLDIVHKLEALNIPYVIIGGFAATIYGITRATYDIDIIVDLNKETIEALADAYPLPRYYADPYQMQNAMTVGSMFNIIDTDRGEKADLFPITMDKRYQPAFDNRVRQLVELPNMNSFEVWSARPEDVIIGKLMAWTELQTKRHESDIYEMMVAEYMGINPTLTPPFDSAYIDQSANKLGSATFRMWESSKQAARDEARRLQGEES